MARLEDGKVFPHRYPNRFTPLPNDLLMVALAFVGMPFKRLAPVLMAGSITVVFLVAYFGEIIFQL